MKGAIGVAALGCALGANGKLLRWSPDQVAERWLPAQQTLSAMLDMKAMTPKPTPAPNAPVPELLKRDSTDNTCAYVNGEFTSSLYCDVADACVYNSHNFYIGCCPETSISCPIPTVCYDSTQAASFSTDNGYTLWCGNTQYPHCLTHKYATNDPHFSSYTLLGCGVAAGSDTVYYQASDAPGSSTARSINAGNTATTLTGTNGGGIATVTVNSSGSETSSSSSGGGGGSSTPIGPIVGGVVGGVGALALVGLAVWLIMRQQNKKKAAAAAAAAAAPPAAGAAGGQHPPPPGPSPDGQYPQMAQYPPAGAWDPNQNQAGFAPVYDPRASIAKPPYDTNTSVYNTSWSTSPPGSPPPHSPHSPANGFNQNNTPPPHGQYPGGYAVQPGSPPTPGSGFTGVPLSSVSPATQNGQHFVAELPSQRGDGEVRELAG